MLTDRQKAILRFEEAWEGSRANREGAIRRTFGVPTTRYFQELYTLLDSPEALEAEPMLVKRLNRIRYARFLNRKKPFTSTRS